MFNIGLLMWNRIATHQRLGQEGTLLEFMTRIEAKNTDFSDI